MHLVRAEVRSLRVGRQTGAGHMSKTPQKRRNGKAPCLGGQQETIIQHIEIVKQRGQIECLTPLLPSARNTNHSISKYGKMSRGIDETSTADLRIG